MLGKEKIFAFQGDPDLFFKKVDERNIMEKLELISRVRGILDQEVIQGTEKLQKDIKDTQKSKNGNEYFVDGRIAYLPMRGKAVFIGDIHGDSISTEAIVRQVEFIEEMEQGNKDFFLVFLGDYIDRGTNDERSLGIVLNLKENYPNNVVLLQGNHEDKDLCGLFGKLPNVLVTACGIVAVHGGIPKEPVSNLLDLKDNEVVFEQIRWNDPSSNVQDFKSNERGYGTYRFGQRSFECFMNSIGGCVMVRGHEYPSQGYELFFNDRLITIFSNGGISAESKYRGEVDPKFMVVPLTELLSKIDPEKHIVAVNQSCCSNLVFPRL